MTKDQEARVIAAVLDGDADRFEELVRAHEKGIYNLCLRMTRSEQDALDASQETFFKAYRALSSFRGESRFSSWLYRLAANTCRDMLRKRPAAPELALEDENGLELPLPDPGPGPQRELEQKELRRAVDQALASLAPEFREAFLLREIGGLSYEEIGRAAGLEEGTVKSRIFRARKKLAAILLKNGNISDYLTSFSSEGRKGRGGEHA